MAQVAVTDRQTGSADGSSLDLSLTVGTGDYLLVCVILSDTAGDKEVSGVDWDATGTPVALSAVLTPHFNPSSGKMRVELWALNAPVANDPATVRITLESGQKFGAIASAWSNVDIAGTPVENKATQDGTDTSGSVSVTQEADDLAVVFASHFNGGGDAFGIGSGETELEDFDVQGSFRMWFATEDGAAATTLSWTQTQSKERATVGLLINAGVVDQDVTVTPASSAWSAPAVTVALGGVSVAPAIAVAAWSAPAVTVLPVFNVTVTPAVATWGALALTITFGGINVTAAPAVATWSAPAVTITFGGINVIAAPAIATWSAPTVTVVATSEQEGYRWRNDDGSESAATWIVAQDTDIIRGKQINTRLRVLANWTNNPPTQQATLQYRKVGDADIEWRDVPL